MSALGLLRKMLLPPEKQMVSQNLSSSPASSIIDSRIGTSDYIFDIIHPDSEKAAFIKSNNYLADFAANVASQGGEDGIIAKIIDIMEFNKPGWCVEFGACDGRRDSNTYNLVKNFGWKAVYIEPDPDFFRDLQSYCDQTPGTWCLNEFVGTEGSNSLDNILARTPIPADFELMVVDIDGPDYYVWEKVEEYRPQIVSIEFHRLISPEVFYVPPRDNPANRPSSLRALWELGKSKEYELVAVINWNAFFVRKEHYAKFSIQDNRPESMFYPYEEMRIMQGYDGTLLSHPIDTCYWRYQRNAEGLVNNIKISQRDLQVLPDGLRIFRPRHTYRSITLENQAGKLDSSQVPGNILLQYRRNITSENGEDGILAYIFETIGTSCRFAVYIGACDGKKWSNSWNMFQQGWQGLLIEAENQAFKKLEQYYENNQNIRCINERVTSDNINALLEKHQVQADFDLLCIDIEGNDYHLLLALESTPAVIVMDFNPSISNDIRFIQADNPDLHYGSSLYALDELARGKGYALCAVTDWNAIFVRNDLFPKLGLTDNALNRMYYPPFEMRIFQTPDTCLNLTGFTALARQDYPVSWEDFQVLPKRMRGYILLGTQSLEESVREPNSWIPQTIFY